MPYVITEPCIGTCDTACVTVCPVDCIQGPVTREELEAMNASERKRRVERVQLFIDPATCIDCGLCQSMCPVDAIFSSDEVPQKWQRYVELNAAYFDKR